MDSETTKKQIEDIDGALERWTPSYQVSIGEYCQAKLALVQALEIQERMERQSDE